MELATLGRLFLSPARFRQVFSFNGVGLSFRLPFRSLASEILIFTTMAVDVYVDGEKWMSIGPGLHSFVNQSAFFVDGSLRFGDSIEFRNEGNALDFVAWEYIV